MVEVQLRLERAHGGVSREPFGREEDYRRVFGGGAFRQRDEGAGLPGARFPSHQQRRRSNAGGQRGQAVPLDRHAAVDGKPDVTLEAAELPRGIVP
jgi:hypothetical protein